MFTTLANDLANLPWSEIITAIISILAGWFGKKHIGR